MKAVINIKIAAFSFILYALEAAKHYCKKCLYAMLVNGLKLYKDKDMSEAAPDSERWSSKNER